jgi:hypothetical protein
LALHVLTFEAERMAQECRELQAELRQGRKCLLAFDRATAGKIPLPGSVRAVLDNVTVQEVSAADPAPWARAAAALLVDPMAALEIAPLRSGNLPARTVPPEPDRWRSRLCPKRRSVMDDQPHPQLLRAVQDRDKERQEVDPDALDR